MYRGFGVKTKKKKKKKERLLMDVILELIFKKKISIKNIIIKKIFLNGFNMGSYCLIMGDIGSYIRKFKLYFLLVDDFNKCFKVVFIF